MSPLSHLRTSDPEVYNAVMGEARRQEEGIELIASENFVSRAVLDYIYLHGLYKGQESPTSPTTKGQESPT